MGTWYHQSATVMEPEKDRSRYMYERMKQTVKESPSNQAPWFWSKTSFAGHKPIDSKQSLINITESDLYCWRFPAILASALSPI